MTQHAGKIIELPDSGPAILSKTWELNGHPGLFIPNSHVIAKIPFADA